MKRFKPPACPGCGVTMPLDATRDGWTCAESDHDGDGPLFVSSEGWCTPAQRTSTLFQAADGRLLWKDRDGRWCRALRVDIEWRRL